jgi:hypothetical protein
MDRTTDRIIDAMWITIFGLGLATAVSATYLALH